MAKSLQSCNGHLVYYFVQKAALSCLSLSANVLHSRGDGSMDEQTLGWVKALYPATQGKYSKY